MAPGAAPALSRDAAAALRASTSRGIEDGGRLLIDLACNAINLLLSYHPPSSPRLVVAPQGSGGGGGGVMDRAVAWFKSQQVVCTSFCFQAHGWATLIWAGVTAILGGAAMQTRLCRYKIARFKHIPFPPPSIRLLPYYSNCTPGRQENAAALRAKVAALGLAAVLAYGFFDGISYTAVRSERCPHLSRHRLISLFDCPALACGPVGAQPGPLPRRPSPLRS